jgi:hypothetical protein
MAEPTTCELAFVRRGFVYIGGVVSVMALTLLGWVGTGAAPTQAYTATSEPWAVCAGASVAAAGVLEASMSPADNTAVRAGTAVTFSGHSEVPVTFAVASSPAALSSPDIDTGLGSAQPEPFSSGSPLSYAYTYSSTKASATPRTVYWAASFSNGDLAECAGVAPSTYVTKARTLTVMPEPPAPAVEPVITPAPVVEQAPVHAGIGKLGKLDRAHPIITYRVHCTTSCSGTSSYRVLVVRHHAKAVGVPALDSGVNIVSITAAAGGDQQIAHHYRGSSSRVLKRIIHSGEVVEVQIDVKVTDESGNVSQAHATLRLLA